MPASSSSSAATLSPRQLIHTHGGRVTRTRVAVIEALQASAQPLTQDEIAARLAISGHRHDRVTVYRTLDWLVARGIAKRIASDERAWRFELQAGSSHHHAHFHCDRCGQVLCLEELPAELPARLPAGFALARSEWVLHGACARCNQAASSRAEPC